MTDRPGSSTERQAVTLIIKPAAKHNCAVSESDPLDGTPDTSNTIKVAMLKRRILPRYCSVFSCEPDLLFGILRAILNDVLWEQVCSKERHRVDVKSVCVRSRDRLLFTSKSLCQTSLPSWQAQTQMITIKQTYVEFMRWPFNQWEEGGRNGWILSLWWPCCRCLTLLRTTPLLLLNGTGL